MPGQIEDTSPTAEPLHDEAPTPVVPLSLEHIKLAQYRQQQKVQRLHQLIYSHSDPTQASEFDSEPLEQAEAELHRLNQQRRQLEAQSKKGILFEMSSGKHAGEEMMGKDTTGIEVQVSLRMSHIPTGIAHLLEVKEKPLITYHLKYSGKKYVRLRLISYIDGYSSRAIETVELTAKNSEATVNQLPVFFADRLRGVTELTRATLHIQVDDLDQKTERQSTFPIWLLARTSAYNGVYDPAKGKWIDLSYYCAAWVTPNDAEVMRLLRRAAELHPEKHISGYQVDKAEVHKQVEAIYNALKAEEITYIHSITSFGAGKMENMQRVRLPRESLLNKSANCIDGTVLMASILEAASLNPALVFVPGHAFLAWETQEGNNDWDFVETTMIGTDDFNAAVKSGRLQAARQKKKAKQTLNPEEFSLFSLAELRSQRGIMPME
jgi:hypothetical protein